MVTNRLDGKVALVTGAGRGLGQAIAIGLAEAGAAIAGLDAASGFLSAVGAVAVGVAGSSGAPGSTGRSLTTSSGASPSTGSA